MSWDGYRTIIEGAGCDAAVLGHNGSLCSKSKGLELSQAEINAMCSSFSSPPTILASGLKIRGEKYMGIAATDDEVYVKKGQCGAVLCKTPTAILVGVHTETTTPGQCRNTVGKLADYLKEQCKQ